MTQLMKISVIRYKSSKFWHRTPPSYSKHSYKFASKPATNRFTLTKTLFPKFIRESDLENVAMYFIL